ncbi:MAG TPA: SpoIVB peptidase S55 domain-containing protein [Candidatus Polarisedimenticolia bacterium]
MSHLRLALPALLTLALSVAPAAEPPAPAPERVEIMPLSEVRPGMRATARTVFEGDRSEEFQAEILGVMDNSLGPGQSLILARLTGPRVEFTGVAAGMSGSPVYVEGRLVGAISYRLGTFLKEAIAGVTPIEYMLELGSDEGAGAAVASLPSPESFLRDPGAFAGRLEPIEAPVVAVGAPARALQLFAEDLARLGLGTVVPGGAAGPTTGGGPAPGSNPVRPGDPIAMQLATGDISMGATGTVTHVDGNRLYAFGHPGFLYGAADVPMARAEIYLTLASVQASTKMGRTLDTIGTFTQSRLPGIAGVMGPVPRMLPLTVRMGGLDMAGAASPGAAAAPERVFHYEVLDHRDFTPLLVAFLTASSLFNTPWYADEMTLSLSGRIGLEGHPDLILNDLYTGIAASQPALVDLTRDVQSLFGAVFQNRFERAKVRSIDLKIDTVERARLSFVEGVYPTRTEVDPGEEVEFRVLIRPFRGDAYTRKFVYRVPEGCPEGTLNVFVGGANLMGASERNLLGRQVSQADNLDQLITLINRLRTSDKLYMKLTRRIGGAVVLSEVMPALPPSVLATLVGNRGSGEVTPLAETTLHEEEIPLGQIIVGGTMIPLNVR